MGLRQILFALGTLLTLLPAAMARELPDNDSVYQCNKDRFQKYPVSTQTNMPSKEIDFSSYPKAREFRTRIREAYTGTPNFNGHYTIATWGEGSPVCSDYAIIDNLTGKIIFYSPEEYQKSSDQKYIFACAEPSFRRDSSLIILSAACEGEKDFWKNLAGYAGFRESLIPHFVQFEEKNPYPMQQTYFDYKQYEGAEK
jgi:hypothetical protein